MNNLTSQPIVWPVEVKYILADQIGNPPPPPPPQPSFFVFQDATYEYAYFLGQNTCSAQATHLMFSHQTHLIVSAHVYIHM